MVDTLSDSSYDVLYSSNVGAVIKTMCAYQNSR